MIYFPALASATSDDVMIGMLAVSASRARSSSSWGDARNGFARTPSLERQLHALVGELAARTFREFYMSESVLARRVFVPGSRIGVRKSHRRILRRTFGHSAPSPGPTRTPDSGFSLSRFDPRPGRPHFSNFGPPAERRPWAGGRGGLRCPEPTYFSRVDAKRPT